MRSGRCCRRRRWLKDCSENRDGGYKNGLVKDAGKMDLNTTKCKDVRLGKDRFRKGLGKAVRSSCLDAIRPVCSSGSRENTRRK